jgi:hypothetical protein
VSRALASRAASIRDYLSDHPDRGLVRKYSFVAARWEETKLAQRDGKTTPDDDQRFRELTDMLLVMTKKLGLGDTVTGWNDFLHRDPGRLIWDDWVDDARSWFG